MSRCSYSDIDIIVAVLTCSSKAQVLRNLGLKAKGGNYRILNNNIQRLQLSTDHFRGKGYLKGKTHNWAKKIPLDKIMVKNSTYQTNKLRKRLLDEGFFEEKCYKCGLVDWCGEKLSFELEHINGNSSDHRLENLTLLCPNCHSQTDTYRGRNIGK